VIHIFKVETEVNSTFTLSPTFLNMPENVVKNRITIETLERTREGGWGRGESLNTIRRKTMNLLLETLFSERNYSNART